MQLSVCQEDGAPGGLAVLTLRLSLSRSYSNLMAGHEFKEDKFYDELC